MIHLANLLIYAGLAGFAYLALGPFWGLFAISCALALTGVGIAREARKQ